MRPVSLWFGNILHRAIFKLQNTRFRDKYSFQPYGKSPTGHFDHRGKHNEPTPSTKQVGVLYLNVIMTVVVDTPEACQKPYG